MNKIAMVLNGGFVKGAFQAGAIRAVLEKGYKPTFIYGISIGSLNATILCHEAARQNRPFEDLDWGIIGDELVKFWETRITKTGDLVRKHGWFGLAFNIMTGKFDGLVDNSPFKKLVYRGIDLELLRKSPVSLRIGAVNIRSGAIMYADPSMDNFHDYVIASASLPMIMPGMKIGGDKNRVFFDGGLRDIAPLRTPIQSGAGKIFCVGCHPTTMDDIPFNYMDMPALAERITDISTNEILNRDIKNAEWINKFVPSGGTPALDGPFKGKRRLDLVLIRPDCTNLIDITNFTTTDIAQMLESGYKTAMESLDKEATMQ